MNRNGRHHLSSSQIDSKADDALGPAGAFVYQSNTIYLDVSSDEFLRERVERRKLQRLDDWKQIRWFLTYRHELDHLAKCTTSPLLAFVDDLYDLQMSSFDHAMARLLRSRPSVTHLERPLLEMGARNELPADVVERVGRVMLMKSTIDRMVFSKTTPRELVHDLNWSIRMVAASKGLDPSNVSQVETRLPLDETLAAGKTIVGLLEASARWQESGTLHEYEATARARESWARSKIFGVYAQFYPELAAQMDMDVMAILLALCTQGRFFPFTSRRTFLLEDVHPLILLQRMIVDLRDCGLLGAGPRSREQILDVYRNAYARLRNQFDLVHEADEFVENRRALDAQFSEEFPDVQGSFQYQTYLLERQRLQVLRNELFQLQHEDPLCLANRHEFTPDRFLTRDAVYVHDDGVAAMLYERNKGPLLAHDRRMGRGALGDWLTFGARDLFDFWHRMISAVFRSYQMEFGSARDWIAGQYGIEVRF